MCFKTPNRLIFFSFAQMRDQIASLFMLPPILKQKIHVKSAFSALLHRLTGGEGQLRDFSIPVHLGACCHLKHVPAVLVSSGEPQG